MMSGNAPWTNSTIDSLGIEFGICREFADVAVNEMEASVDNETLDSLFKAGIKGLNENLQDGLALGAFIIKPFMGGVEYVTADRFIPIEFDDEGGLKDCVLIQHKQEDEHRHYFRCERHTLTKQGLRITNEAYSSTSAASIGPRIDLNTVSGWENYPEEVTYSGMNKMDFGFYKSPLKNRIDDSGCGVSVYSPAVNLIRKADIQGARLDWEFESGERAIHVDERALNHDKKSGKYGTAKLNRRLYRGLNIDQNNQELFKEYSPEMRNESFNAGLENYLRRIEFAVGLAYGDLSDVSYVDKTATEVKIAKQRKYNRVAAIQENLKTCLSGFVDALAFYNALYTSGYTFSCSFNDSILTDEEAERNQDRQDVSMGVMSLSEYRSKWYGEDLETAEANLPEAADPVLDTVQLKQGGLAPGESDPEIQNKTLNGAQTQSLLAIIAQFASGELTEGQAVKLISTAIGLTTQEARQVLNGEI